MARMFANTTGGGGAAGAPSGQGQVSAQAANHAGRARLLATGIPMCRIVQQNYSLTMGQANRINLLRTGLAYGVRLDFDLDLDITAGMTASPTGPWSVIDRLVYTDFDGTDRVDVNGFELWLSNTVSRGRPSDNAVAGVISGFGNIDTDILTNPVAIANPSHTYFSLWVPFAADPEKGDLRGIVPALTNVGEHYLTITPVASIVNANDVLEGPYTAGTATVTSLNVDVTMFYIQPQSVAAQDLPAIDLTTIYELKGRLDKTDGLQSNGTAYVNYPNDRMVLSATFQYENGGTMTLNGSDLSKLSLLVNGNTVFRENTPRSFRGAMREFFGSDLPSGVYYQSHRRQPILTSKFATVQEQFFLNTVNAGTTKIRQLYESVYPSGRPLAGISPNG